MNHRINQAITLIEKHLLEVFFVVFIALAIGIRIYNFDYLSGDYWNFLRVWMTDIVTRGGLASLASSIGDYSVPYVFILTLLSYITTNWLHGIKYVSVFFDVVMAIGVGYWYYKNSPKKTSLKQDSLLIVLIVLFAPTVYMNSALWAQSDSIYTAFIIWSLVALSAQKYHTSFILYGIAFAFKLQSIFILPVFILVIFFNKPTKIYLFGWIPVVYYTLSLPAIVAGRSLVDISLIYFRQTSTYGSMTMNMPNLYQWFPNRFDVFAPYAIALFILAMASIFFYFLHSHYRVKRSIILLLSLWSILAAVYLLPAMHERYLYMADVIAIAYYFYYRKNGWITISVLAISTLSYFPFLFGFNAIDMRILAALYAVLMYVVTKELLQAIKQSNIDASNVDA